MKIREITWQQTIPLRHRVLWPSKPPEYCHVDGDSDALHFGAFIDEQLICVASVYTYQNKARLRKFATDPNHQNQGVGSAVLSYILEHLTGSPVEYFWCDARESATEFYQRFGMDKCSQRFYKEEISYFKMEVALS